MSSSASIFYFDSIREIAKRYSFTESKVKKYVILHPKQAERLFD